jgi:tetratricopeptide (TPR) repeat protein
MKPSAPTAIAGLYRVVPAVLAALSVAISSAGSPEPGQGEDEAAGPSAIERSCVAELASAYEAVEAGKAEDALRHYRAAVGMATSDALRFQSLLGLGSTYAALQQYDTAVPPLERARDLAPDNAEVWYTLGTVYSAAGRPEDALRALGEAARLEPGMAAARGDICRLLSGLGRYSEAAVACRSAVESEPTHVAAWIGLGVAGYQLGAYDDASAAFREALALEPGNQGAVYGLGLSLTSAGDRDGAIAQYLRLKELDPALAQDLYRRIFP